MKSGYEMVLPKDFRDMDAAETEQMAGLDSLLGTVKARTVDSDGNIIELHVIEYREDISEGWFYNTTTNYYQRHDYNLSDVRISSSNPYNVKTKTELTTLSKMGIGVGIATLIGVGVGIGIALSRD